MREDHDANVWVLITRLIWTDAWCSISLPTMMSWHWKSFRTIGPLWSESTGDRCMGLWCFVSYLSEQTVEQTYIATTRCLQNFIGNRYNDVTMGVIGSQITSYSTVYLTICSGQHQRNINAPRYWRFVMGNPNPNPTQRAVTRKSFHLLASSWSWWKTDISVTKRCWI